MSSPSDKRCPFCELPAEDRTWSGELVFAFRDRYPVSPGHTLIVPERHVATWFDATGEEQRALLDAVHEVKAQLDRELAPRPDGYNVGFNAGEAAGQTVMHLHVHVIPRYRGDMDDPRGGVRHVIPSKGNYLAQPSPLATGADDPFARHILPLLAEATDVAIVAAFVQQSGLDRLRSGLEEALRRDATVRLLTGDYLGITQVAALESLVDWMAARTLRDDGDERPPPAGQLAVRVVQLVDTLMARPPEDRWIAQGDRRATLTGVAARGGLRIEGDFAPRTVSLTDLAWVAVARRDVEEHGGRLDEARVNRLRYLEGTPKSSTRYIDTGWAIAAWERSAR